MSDATAPAAKPSNLNLPNALTTLRILLVPVYGWFLLGHDHEEHGAMAETLAPGVRSLAAPGRRGIADSSEASGRRAAPAGWPVAVAADWFPADEDPFAPIDVATHAAG